MTNGVRNVHEIPLSLASLIVVFVGLTLATFA